MELFAGFHEIDENGVRFLIRQDFLHFGNYENLVILINYPKIDEIVKSVKKVIFLIKLVI